MPIGRRAGGSEPIGEEKPIVVIVRKFNGAEHRRWSARLLDRTESLIVLDATFEEHVEHELLGPIPVGTLSTEYYWLDRWYNVFCFRNPEGTLKNFYCNINMPPDFDGATLTYIDLDIDILVEPDFSYRILDWEDFAENARHYDYPPELQTQARNAVAELIDLIETRSYPFTIS